MGGWWASRRLDPAGRRPARWSRPVATRGRTRLEASDIPSLTAWAASLPWVGERPGPAATGIRMLAVDCEPLRQRRTWLVLGRFDGEAGPDEVRVVVPRRVAARFRSVVAADDVEALGDDWELRAVRSDLDRGPAAEQVEQLLLAAYHSAFEDTPRREGP